MALTCLIWQYRTCGSLHRFLDSYLCVPRDSCKGRWWFGPMPTFILLLDLVWFICPLFYLQNNWTVNKSSGSSELSRSRHSCHLYSLKTGRQIVLGGDSLFSKQASISQQTECFQTQRLINITAGILCGRMLVFLYLGKCFYKPSYQIPPIDTYAHFLLIDRLCSKGKARK